MEKQCKVFLGFFCIYNKECLQSIKEEYLLTGSIESSNLSCALAKIASIEICWAYIYQYHTQFLSVIPINLYSPGDNCDLGKFHAILDP